MNTLKVLLGRLRPLAAGRKKRRGVDRLLDQLERQIYFAPF